MCTETQGYDPGDLQAVANVAQSAAWNDLFSVSSQLWERSTSPVSPPHPNLPPPGAQLLWFEAHQGPFAVRAEEWHACTFTTD